MTTPRRRKILRNVEFVEFSAVDVPAHEGALAAIRKSKNLITIEPLQETPTMTTPDLATVQASLAKALGDLTAMTANRDALQAQVTYLTKAASLSDAERGYLETLDESDRAAWVGKSKAARAADVAKAEADDPVIDEVGGIKVRKSSDPLLLGLVRMNKTLLATQTEQAAAIDRTRLEKRAGAELNHAGGTVDGKVALLKAVEGITDEAARTAASAVLKSANDALSVIFKRQGGTPPPDASPTGDATEVIGKRAEAYAKQHNVPVAKAWGIILDPSHEHFDPEAAAAYDQQEADRRGNR